MWVSEICGLFIRGGKNHSAVTANKIDIIMATLRQRQDVIRDESNCTIRFNLC